MTTHSEQYVDRAEVIRRAIALHRKGLEQAPDWKDPDARAEALNIAQSLLDTGMFSIRAIARISLLGMSRTRDLRRSVATGGRIEPEALPRILELLLAEDLRNTHEVSETSVRALQAALATGTSIYMVERLTGLPETTLRRWAQAEVSRA